MGKDAASIAELTASASSRSGLRSAESFGAVFVVHEVAKSGGMAHALGSSDDAKLALWQVCARVLSPAPLLLVMIRLAGSCAAARLLGFETPFNEDDLYLNGSGLVERQAKVEAKLWQWHQANRLSSPDTTPDVSPNSKPVADTDADAPAAATAAADAVAAPEADPASPPSLFFYDVTSSYFEGSHNTLAAFGYNRDKIKGKSQVVMGLLTDATGEPISMIRRPQQQEANEAGYNYISALHKTEILTLLKTGEVQMELFDNNVQEVTLQDGRRLVARCNPVRRDEIAASRQGYLTRMEAWVAKANLYLQEHPGAKESTQLKLGLQRLEKGKLSVWITLEVKERVIRLQQDTTLLKKHAKLDGCYAIVSDLPPAIASSQNCTTATKTSPKSKAAFAPSNTGIWKSAQGMSPAKPTRARMP